MNQFGTAWNVLAVWRLPETRPMNLQKDLSSRVFEPNLKSLVQEARAGLLVKGNGERLSVGRAETIARQAIEFVAIR
jgi:hypothetical protein